MTRHAAEAVGLAEAFARSGDVAREAVRIQSEDLATVLLRFDDGAKGSVSVGQVCAGHKNGLWFEVNGRQASLRWEQERQNELWIGRRDAANSVLAKDPSLLAPGARAYAHLPGGHQEAWADAFCNVMRDVYGFIAAARARDAVHRRPSRPSKTDIIRRASSTPFLRATGRCSAGPRSSGGSEGTRPTDVGELREQT